MKSDIVRIALAVTAAITILSAGACQPRTDPKITHLAEFYVQRFTDSTAADTLADTLSDSARVAARQAELDSLTARWTPDDWNDFWYEVDRLRQP